MCLPEGITLPKTIRPEGASVVCCKQGTVKSEEDLDAAADAGAGATADVSAPVDAGNWDKSYCQESKTNRCSDSFSSNPQKWYAFCPQATPKACGGF